MSSANILKLSDINKYFIHIQMINNNTYSPKIVKLTLNGKTVIFDPKTVEWRS